MKRVVKLFYSLIFLGIIGCSGVPEKNSHIVEKESMRVPSSSAVFFEGKSYNIPMDSFTDAYVKCTNAGYADCYPGPLDDFSDWKSYCEDDSGLFKGKETICTVSAEKKTDKKRIFWGPRKNIALESFNDAYKQCVRAGYSCKRISLDEPKWRNYCVDSTLEFGGHSLRCYIEGIDNK